MDESMVYPLQDKWPLAPTTSRGGKDDVAPGPLLPAGVRGLAETTPIISRDVNVQGTMDGSMVYPLRMMWPRAPYYQQEWAGMAAATPIISDNMNVLLFCMGGHGRIHGLPTAG